jgi:RimJ/RimL family protein N-acetyltransferase
MLRPFQPEDIDQLAEMVADPMQMTFYERPKTRGEAGDWLDWNLGLYESHGFGTWCVELADGTFGGYCGIRPLTLDGIGEFELAWHIKKTYWNRGMATEAAREAIRLGFDRHELPSLVAIITPENAASLRVAEKLGMRAEGATFYEGEPVVLCRLKAPGRSLVDRRQRHSDDVQPAVQPG